MNRRSVIAAACALACFFAVDWWLYSRLGFTRTFGQATQEGQIVSKVARAAPMAEQADVIAFGSSYVRSGLSGQPFFDRGLLLWNFGISGAGPLTDYFALKRIAPVLAARAVKPVLLLELKTDAIQRNRDKTLWAEYPQYLGIVRTRTERLAESPLLFTAFHEAEMTSQYITSVVIPSAIYRSYNVQLIERGGPLDGSFYGMEDATGYAPLYTVSAIERGPDHGRLTSLSRDQWLNGKVAAIRRFLQLAHALSCPVVLYASPTTYLGDDADAFDELWPMLKREFSDALLLRTDEYPLGSRDFDEGGHPNLRGSDKLSRFLIDRLSLRGGALDEKIHAVFDVYDVPPAVSWTLSGARASAVSQRAFEIDGSASATKASIATSPPIRVTADREFVFDLGLGLARGRLLIRLVWRNSRTGRMESTEIATPVELPEYGPEGRVFLRGTPHSGEAWIEVSDYGALTGEKTAVGRIEALRFWSNRP